MGKLLDTTQGVVSDYETGKLLPPLSRVSDIATLLDLSGDERRTFIEEANLAHAPETVRNMMQDLRAELRKAHRLLLQKGVDPPGL